MDANQTRLHLLLGLNDWSRCRVWLPELHDKDVTLRECWDASPPGLNCGVEWNSERNELTLRSKPFHFSASTGDRRPQLGTPENAGTSDRRGAARDLFGSWYYISQDRREILVHSVGCKH